MKTGTVGQSKSLYGKGRLKAAQGKASKLGRAKTIASPFDNRVVTKR